jgi:hypothetical protein
MNNLHKISAQEEEPIWINANGKRIPASALSNEYIRNIMSYFNNKSVTRERADMIGQIYKEAVRRNIKCTYLLDE